MLNSIIWPTRFTPGMTDNFVSNEIIVPNLTVSDVWPCIIDTSKWPTYYSNVSQIVFHDGSGPKLRHGARFVFTTFTFPMESEVAEFVPPSPDNATRLAWQSWTGETPENRLDIYHAWLFEDLPGNRVRIVTQESQLGQPAKDMAVTKPNPMLNAHQEWIEGLAHIASQAVR